MAAHHSTRPDPISRGQVFAVLLNPDHLEGWRKYLTNERGLSPNTLEAYTRALAAFSVWLKRSPLTACTDDVRGFLGYQLSSGMAGASAAHTLAGLRSFFHYCLLDGLIKSDPTLAVDRPRFWNRVPQPLETSEINALLATPTTSRHQAMIELFHASGLRVSELVNAQLANLNLDNRTLLIVCGKFAKDRIVPFGIPAVNALRQYIEEERAASRHSASPFLFIGRAGDRLSRQWVFKLLQRLGIAAGIAYIPT